MSPTAAGIQSEDKRTGDSAGGSSLPARGGGEGRSAAGVVTNISERDESGEKMQKKPYSRTERVDTFYSPAVRWSVIVLSGKSITEYIFKQT